MSWRRLCKRKLITGVQEVVLIAERLFYWHREPFKALWESSAKGREEAALGRQVSWVKRDWRERV